MLVKPNIHVSTAEAYAGVIPQIPFFSIRNCVEQKPASEWRNSLKNDFEESVFKNYPIISEIKNTLYDNGAVYASMSGSGSTVFGLFKFQIDLHEQFTGMTYWAGSL